MSTWPQKQISCKKYARVDAGARVSILGEAVMASVPYGVPAAALCRGIVRHSAKGTIRKDSATTLRSLSIGVVLRFYAPISPSFPASSRQASGETIAFWPTLNADCKASHGALWPLSAVRLPLWPAPVRVQWADGASGNGGPYAPRSGAWPPPGRVDAELRASRHARPGGRACAQWRHISSP